MEKYVFMCGLMAMFVVLLLSCSNDSSEGTQKRDGGTDSVTDSNHTTQPDDTSSQGEADRDTACDDQTEILSERLCGTKPECNDDQLLAVRGGCWVCVNPTTCLASI
jgi:hypothetical protein